jgi:antitoxin component YwqK of YwqJK toxin-antitoxin module
VGRSPSSIALIVVAACGTAPSAPKATPPIEPTHGAAGPAGGPGSAAAQVAPIDAGVPDAPPPRPRLACAAGTAARAITTEGPTTGWACLRPDGTREGSFVALFPDDTLAGDGGYADGALDGPWRRFHPGGALAEDGAYAVGKKDGRWRQLAPDGRVLGEYSLIAGTGIERRWYPSGQLYWERRLQGGIASGPATTYDVDGTVLVTERFAAGKLDGHRTAGTKATMLVDEEFRGGVRTGDRALWRRWVDVIDEAYDRHGQLDGPVVVWRDKKTPRLKGAYRHGHRDGPWVWTNRDNDKEREGTYAAGRKVGTFTEWVENKVVFTGSYSANKPDGRFTYFDGKGDEIGGFDMKDGTGWMLTFHPNHKVSSRTHFYAGSQDGGYQELTPKGKLVVEGHFSNGRRHGSWHEQTPEGVPLLDAHYKRNKLDGAFKKYEGGKVVVAATYVAGLLEGAYVESRGGRPAVTGTYLHGLRTGTWTTYDPDGRVIATASWKDDVLDGPWRALDGPGGEAVVEGPMAAGRRTGTWTRTERGGAVTHTTYPPIDLVPGDAAR